MTTTTDIWEQHARRYSYDKRTMRIRIGKTLDYLRTLPQTPEVIEATKKLRGE